MKIMSACSTHRDAQKAVDACCEELNIGNCQDLKWLLVFHTEGYDSSVILKKLTSRAGKVPIQGGTSCLGVMSAKGFHSREGSGMGILAISDPDGSYGVGASTIGDNPRRAAAAALEAALEDADRDGEIPTLVWMNAAPGNEEALIKGIEDIIGPDVPVAGGSTADNTVSGNWRQIAGTQVFMEAVVVGVLFPSVEVPYAFHSGYDPTPLKGTVTKADGRTLYEIDGQPAGNIYNEWTGGLVTDVLATGGNVLSSTTLAPLGREVGRVGGVPYYKLSPPDQVTVDGGLTLFADIEKGDDVILMKGSRDSLVSRAGRVTQSAISAGEFKTGSIQGAIAIYCAGCMLTVQEDMDRVAGEIASALDSAPFLGVFTFGEQGCFVGRENSHGNLMISVVVFSDIPAF